MTENLRKELAQGEVLMPATSDVTSNVTVGATTQPYDQASDNYYDWGVGTGGTQTEANTDRWLSRSTKKDGVWTTETTPIQNVSEDRRQDLTGEDQKTGVYYNWYTATAGTGTWSITTAGTQATDSICPAGWKLPNDSSTDSWYDLVDAYGLTAGTGAAKFPLSLPRSGNVRWQEGSVSVQGQGGSFWSNTVYNQTYAQYLTFNSTLLRPQWQHPRLEGFSVRCVAK